MRCSGAYDRQRKKERVKREEGGKEKRSACLRAAQLEERMESEEQQTSRLQEQDSHGGSEFARTPPRHLSAPRENEFSRAIRA